MAATPLMAFRRTKNTDSKYNCFIENTDYTITCTICNKWISFSKKSHLDSHLNSAFHCTMKSVKDPLEKMAKTIDAIHMNTETILARGPTER